MLSVQPKTHPCLNSKDFKGEGERERGGDEEGRDERGGERGEKEKRGVEFHSIVFELDRQAHKFAAIGKPTRPLFKTDLFSIFTGGGMGRGGGGEKREKNNTYFPRPRLIHDQTCHSDWPSMNPWCSTGVTIYSVSWNTETYTFRLRNCKQRWNSATNKQNKCQHFMVVWVCLKKNFMIDLKSS